MELLDAVKDIIIESMVQDVNRHIGEGMKQTIGSNMATFNDCVDIKNTNPGDTVLFHNKGGWDSEKETAAKLLEVGKFYTVDRMVVHNWSSDLYLEGFTQRFNTVQFSNVESTADND